MRTICIVIAALVLCGCEFKARVAVDSRTNGFPSVTNTVIATNESALLTNGVIHLTNISIANWDPGTNFLTISNRPVIRLDGGRCYTTLFKFTDDEWSLLTNYYATNVVSDFPIHFFAPELKAGK